ncbi:hypothetical protein PR048_011041 [Dryococelus australis]|uniref:Uncharacterized protein n=1 Tax=Dryococelus australis TaxID=614101 RepID=A0ABQ9HKZ6_9NEOP|nr:hypothetical protein PR048_011041 [Dryococelus australis]
MIKKCDKGFRFAVPMIWREPRKHCNDCCFCGVDVTGYNSKCKKVIMYPNFPSAIQPVGHGPDMPVPKPPEVFDYIILDMSSDAQSDADEQADDELKEENLLAVGTNICVYRRKEQTFLNFSNKKRLFIDSSKTCLKAVLLHNGNTYSTLPVAHSVHMKESYENLYILDDIAAAKDWLYTYLVNRLC